jgi:conjugative transposon TraM protein
MNEDTQPAIDDQIIDSQVKRRKQGQMLLVLLVSMILIVGGLIYFSSSLTRKKEKQLTDLENIMPLEAKNKKSNQMGKYDKTPKKLADQQYDHGLSEILGQEPVYHRRSNENLTEQDYMEIKKVSDRSAPARKLTSKQALNQQNQRHINRAKAVIAHTADPETPLFKKSAEELAEERQMALERDNASKMTEVILKGLEKASQPLSAQTGHSPSRNTEALVHAKQPLSKGSVLRNNTHINTIARATHNGFHSQSKAIDESGISTDDFIPAVVHGNGEGIRVSNGSNIKLRLLTETYLEVKGNKYVLAANTLINGLVRLADDRVHIVVQSIRLNNAVLPVEMLAYDMDGTQGLHIPNLMDKNLLGRELANAGTRPLQGSIWTQGSIGQQVGSQIATESARTLLQGGSQYARRKMQQVRVTIKPNYKVLLTAGSLDVTEETESITHY